MFTMSEKYCNYYKSVGGAEVCEYNTDKKPHNCESCPAFKKHPYESNDEKPESSETEPAEIYTILEYRSLRKRDEYMFSLKKDMGTIYLTKSCITALGEAESVVFGINAVNTRLKISVCGDGAENAVKLYRRRNRGEVYSAMLARQIAPHGSRGVGRPEAETGSVVFELTKR